jgi:hypothetical protein
MLMGAILGQRRPPVSARRHLIHGKLYRFIMALVLGRSAAAAPPQPSQRKHCDNRPEFLNEFLN